jgi:hypothetical protein
LLVAEVIKVEKGGGGERWCMTQLGKGSGSGNQPHTPGLFGDTAADHHLEDFVVFWIYCRKESHLREQGVACL